MKIIDIEARLIWCGLIAAFIAWVYIWLFVKTYRLPELFTEWTGRNGKEVRSFRRTIFGGPFFFRGDQGASIIFKVVVFDKNSRVEENIWIRVSTGGSTIYYNEKFTRLRKPP